MKKISDSLFLFLDGKKTKTISRYCPSKKACALRNFVCNQTNEMKHLFHSSVDKRYIEENPGTPTPLYSFVNVSTLRQVLEKGDVKRTLVMCFLRVQVSVLM